MSQRGTGPLGRQRFSRSTSPNPSEPFAPDLGSRALLRSTEPTSNRRIHRRQRFSRSTNPSPSEPFALNLGFRTLPRPTEPTSNRRVHRSSSGTWLSYQTARSTPYTDQAVDDSSELSIDRDLGLIPSRLHPLDPSMPKYRKESKRPVRAQGYQRNQLIPTRVNLTPTAPELLSQSTTVHGAGGG